MTGVSALRKETPRSPLAPSLLCGHREKMTSVNEEGFQHCREQDRVTHVRQ